MVIFHSHVSLLEGIACQKCIWSISGHVTSRNCVNIRTTSSQCHGVSLCIFMTFHHKWSHKHPQFSSETEPREWRRQATINLVGFYFSIFCGSLKPLFLSIRLVRLGMTNACTMSQHRSQCVVIDMI